MSKRVSSISFSRNAAQAIPQIRSATGDGRNKCLLLSGHGALQRKSNPAMEPLWIKLHLNLGAEIMEDSVD